MSNITNFGKKHQETKSKKQPKCILCGIKQSRHSVWSCAINTLLGSVRKIIAKYKPNEVIAILALLLGLISVSTLHQMLEKI